MPVLIKSQLKNYHKKNYWTVPKKLEILKSWKNQRLLFLRSLAKVSEELKETKEKISRISAENLDINARLTKNGNSDQQRRPILPS